MGSERGYTPSEFAKARGVSSQWVRTLIRDGRLKATRHLEPLPWYEIARDAKLPTMESTGWPRGVKKGKRTTKLADVQPKRRAAK